MSATPKQHPDTPALSNTPAFSPEMRDLLRSFAQVKMVKTGSAKAAATAPTADDSELDREAFIALIARWGNHLRFLDQLDLSEATPGLLEQGSSFYRYFAQAAEDPTSDLLTIEDTLEMQMLAAYCRLQLELGMDLQQLHQLNEPIAQLCGSFFYLGYCFCFHEPNDYHYDLRFRLLQDLLHDDN